MTNLIIYYLIPNIPGKDYVEADSLSKNYSHDDIEKIYNKNRKKCKTSQKLK